MILDWILFLAYLNLFEIKSFIGVIVVAKKSKRQPLIMTKPISEISLEL
jgi:hypothetical protein